MFAFIWLPPFIGKFDISEHVYIIVLKYRIVKRKSSVFQNLIIDKIEIAEYNCSGGENMAKDIKVGLRIKESRIKAGLTQEELGSKLGIGKSSISEWEKCKRSPDFEKLEEMADVLGVSFHYLIGWSDDPHYPSKERTEILYVSHPTGNESTDELRKMLHDYIDSLSDDELRAMSVMFKIEKP